MSKMRTTPRSATALICFLSFFLFDLTSSVDSPTISKKSEVQANKENQDGQDGLSKSYWKTVEKNNVGIPQKYIKIMSNNVYKHNALKINEESHETTKCRLETTVQKRLKSSSDSEWFINDEALKLIENDPQLVLDCTQSSDRVMFALTGEHKFKRTIEVHQELELISKTPKTENNAVDNRTSTATFTCPDFSPFLIVNSTFQATGFIINNCTASSGNGAVVMLPDASAMFNHVNISSNKNRAFYVSQAAQLTLKNSFFKDNHVKRADGGVIFAKSQAHLILFNSIFLENSARYGGAIHVYDNNSMTIVNCRLHNNTASYGGAIDSNDYNSITITNSSMKGNHADEVGGAIYSSYNNNITVTQSLLNGNHAAGYGGGAIHSLNKNSITITNSLMKGNHADEVGGAIYSSYNNNITVIHSLLNGNNAAGYGGGAIYSLNKNSITITNSSMKGNHADEDGGAIYSRNNNNITVIQSRLNDNDAFRGGAIYSNDQNNITVIQSSRLNGNHADEDGGAIHSKNNNNITVTQSSLNGNRASIHGGAIHSLNQNNITIIQSWLNDNKAAKSGGAIYSSYNNIVTVTQSSLNGNHAAGYGGGAIYSSYNNIVTVTQSSLNDNKAAESGGAIYSSYNNIVTVTQSSLNGNHAAGYGGGAIYSSYNNIVTVTQSSLNGNHAAGYGGGAIHSLNKNSITITNSLMKGNHADEDGGAIYSSYNNNITVIHSLLNGNNASRHGGAIYSEDQNNITVTQSSLNGNNATHSGGAILSLNQNNITIIQSWLNDNNAPEGGTIYVQGDSIVIVSFTLLYRNNAIRGGAIYVNRNIQLTITNSNCTKNNASIGGCLYGDRSSLEFEGCECVENSSRQFGGCLYLEACSINLKSNNFCLNKAKNGGGIYATSRAFLRLEQTHFSSNSAENGGGMAIINDSQLLCLSCTIENNTAIQGGGLFIASNSTQILIAQLTNSMFRSNKASSYGGGILIKTFGIRNLDCTKIKSPCDRVVLFGVIFEKNIARFSSIILATTPENILVSCFGDFSMAYSLITRERIKTAIVNNTLNVLDNEELCSSWIIGWHLNDDPEVAIGTFGHTLNLTTNSIDDSSIKVNDGRGFELDAMRSAKGSLSIAIIALDAFGKYPAPPLIDKDTLELSFPFGNIREDRTFSHDNLTCIIYPIPKAVHLLNYTIKITPKTEDILENTTLKIHINKCEINEDLANNKNTCQECRDGSYNFHPLEIGGCTPCSENANCSGRYIVPNEGYWHKGPCHDKVKECIVDDACNTPNRIEALEQITLNEIDCDINEITLKKYADAQCNKGYEGRLCGSCKESYGSSSSFECIKCKHIIVPILALLGIAFYLLFNCCLSIKGILPFSSMNASQDEINAPLIESNTFTVTQEASTYQVGETSTVANNDSNVNTSMEQRNGPNVLNEQRKAIENAKGKILETWKILLNFFQITSTAATMDIKWTNLMLNLLRKLQIFGAATINAISSPIDCIVSSSSHATRVIWRVVFSLLVPTFVLAIFAVYWAFRTIAIHESDGSYFVKRFVLSLIIVVYITYFDLTQLAVRVFNCVVVHDDVDFESKSTNKAWIADTSIECYKSTHFTLVVIALVVLILVSIGFPLFCSFALFARREAVYIPRSWAHDTLGFLCGPYKKKLIYWECVTMIKKALLSIIIVFSYSLGNHTQGLLILLVLVFFLYIHLRCLPYDQEYHSLNYYESSSLLTSCLTYTLVQFFNVETIGEIFRQVISVALIAINSAFVLLMLFQIVKGFSLLLKAILRSMNIPNYENMNLFTLIVVYYKNRKQTTQGA